ncbi:MAG: hypothetical protein GVY18_02745 [Bacteroidetes bacterium]|jgi:hypothetical protein|nr:hypothetical protein [Bacteroidota bacterium]
MKISTLRILVLSLIVGFGLSQTATAQSSLAPDIDFGVRAMQGAQFIQTDGEGPASEAAPGFQRFRYNLEVNAAFGDRINVFVDLGHEPNDFGTGGNSFAPAVDFAAVDLMLNDQFTFRFGTPVTTLFQFRGYSDGAATQGNPMIGNSPADFVTAETGVQLLGTTEQFSFDILVTSPTFFEDFTPGSGPTVIVKGKLQPTEQFGIGAAIGRVFSSGAVDDYYDGEQSFGQIGEAAGNWLGGDGENYTLAGLGQPNRYTHARLLPGFEATMLQVDAGINAAPITADLWAGYGFEPNSFATSRDGTPIPQGGALTEEDSQMLWFGGTLKFDVNEQFYLAGRGTFVQNASDWAEDDTNLLRIQAGLGYSFLDYALFKLEYVMQTEEANSPGQVGDDWQGVSAELSIGI